MDVVQLRKEDVEIFFNKYKHNTKQIINLERQLLREAYDYGKWHEMLAANSSLTRRLFAENEQLLDMYIRPVMKHPDLLIPETADYYLLHVLFFLFENHRDSFITADLVSAIRTCPKFMTQKGMFDSSLNIAVSRIAGNASGDSETEVYFTEALKCYPGAAGDTATQIHLVFCRLFRILSAGLGTSPDDGLLAQEAEEACRFLETPETIRVYDKMWGPDADFSFHEKLLCRFIRVYAIFGAGRTQFGSDVVAQWLEDEYKAECGEQSVSILIASYYWKMKYCRGNISRERYVSELTSLYRSVRAGMLSHLHYPEDSFPQDDDPVSPKFSDLINTMKLFCDTFAFQFILMQELFSMTSDQEIRKSVISDTAECYTNMPYALEGINLDRFIIENVKLLLPSFTSFEECFAFIQNVFVHRQVLTAIHFTMVSRLAVLCVQHFLKSSPQLFIGLPGISTAEEAVEKTPSIIEFVRHAGLCHDIGKLTCTDYVNLHSRRITDGEFAVLKQHSVIGADIADCVPLFAPYRDIMLGHHKSWDGKKGYPADFDNTVSKYRVIIDLITICDCIDAATDILGRNYAAGKTFPAMLKELQDGAGTRYSPVLVSLIAGDGELVSTITKLTGEGRTDAYYSMYCQYIQPHTSFSPSDERRVSRYNGGLELQIREFYKACYPSESEERIQLHFDEVMRMPDGRIYLLYSKAGQVFGVLAGRFRRPLGAPDVFFIDELIVRPDCRNRGYGSRLAEFMEEDVKLTGCTRIEMDVLKEFHAESFFWINGFTETQYSRMEKKLSAGASVQ